MAEASTIIDLGRLSLSHGEGRRIEVPVHLQPLELGGQVYAVAPATVQARLDVSRHSSGYAFRLRLPLRIEGPCMRCLADGELETEVDAREVSQEGTEDEELRSPYVIDDELDLGRWAHDAAVLAAPTQFLCRPDCAGLCPICGESLNDANPSAHEHEPAPDPRWAKLKELKLKE
ncbi:MAG: YceD family protein [Chloroflexota bacterium]